MSKPFKPITEHELALRVAANLKTLRHNKGVGSMLELAQKAGVSPRSYFEWETGARAPRLDSLVVLANFYKVDVSRLLARAD